MLALRIALRYLFSKKSHNAVNVISAVSMIGVMVATAAIICVLSVFNGFTTLTMSRLSRIDPPLKIIPAAGKVIAAPDSIINAIGALEGVGCAFPSINEQALAIYRGRQIPVRLIGLTAGHRRFMPIDSMVIDGEYSPEMEDSLTSFAAISVGVASHLGAHPGWFDWLALYAPRRIGRINAAMPMGSFTSDSLVVSAVYEALDPDFDASTVVVPIDVTRRLFDYPVEASAIDVYPQDGTDIAKLQQAVKNAAGGGVIVLNRLEQEDTSYRMISVEKWISFAMLAFILIIASFNVVSTLSMLIIEKRGNISTLRAIGATDRMIRRVFLLEGWLVSAIGSLLGIVVGIGLTLAQQYGGFIKLGADPSKLTITVYPVHLEATDIVVVAALSLVVGYLVGAVTTLFMQTRVNQPQA